MNLGLDALVAVKVMGWTCDPDLGWYSPDGYFTGQPFPPLYSSNIEAAWEVVEKLDLLGPKNIRQYGRVCYYLSHPEDKRWQIGDDRDMSWTVEAETAPHVICLAALKAVGYEPPQG
jgi:hypothetical protein